MRGKAPERWWMIVHVDMDAFFVAVEQLLNPALRGKPVAVGGSPDGRGVIASASYEARKFGVRSAMPSYQAKKLCPQLTFVRPHFQQYADCSDAVADVLSRFSPDVEWVSIDEAYINILGTERIHGTAMATAEKIHHVIDREVHLSASLGIARNRVMAKVASDFAKPGGVLLILPNHEESFLRPLPIRRLPGIGEKMETQLREMGISTIGELASMPLDLLRATFGISGYQLWKRAHGMESEWIAPPTSQGAKSISREVTLDEDTTDPEYLSAVLHLLIEKAAQELRKTRRKARTITLKLRYTDLKRVTRSITLDRGTALDEEIYRSAAGLLIEHQKCRIRVRLIGIHLSHFQPETGQMDLFPDFREIQSQQLHERIDAVRERFGFDSLRTGQSILLPTG